MLWPHFIATFSNEAKECIGKLVTMHSTNGSEQSIDYGYSKAIVGAFSEGEAELNAYTSADLPALKYAVSPLTAQLNMWEDKPGNIGSSWNWSTFNETAK